MDITCKGQKAVSSCCMFSVLPGTWCFCLHCLKISHHLQILGLQTQKHLWNSLFCNDFSKKEAPIGLNLSNKNGDVFVLEGIFICFHFGFYLRINKNQTQPPNCPNQPNQRRKHNGTDFGDPSCKAKRLGARQKEQILLGALVTPCYNYGCYRWCFFVERRKIACCKPLFEMLGWILEDLNCDTVGVWRRFIFLNLMLLVMLFLLFPLISARIRNQGELWSSQKWGGYNISLETSWYS